MTLAKALVIDRLKITGLNLSKAQYSHARNQLTGIVDIKSDLNLGTATLKYSQIKYVQGVSLRSTKEPNQTLARISVGSTETKTLYLAWEIYPHALQHPQHRQSFTAFNDYIDLLFGENFNYNHAYELGKVQYIELAKDYLSNVQTKIIPHSSSCKSSNIFPGTANQYIGKKYVLYDKKQQLQQVKNLNTNWETVFRIEAKARRTGITPCQLLTLPNPFQGLELASLAPARAILDPLWHQFLDNAQKCGVNDALTTQSEQTRKKFRSLLRSCAVPWFKPEHLWASEWPKAVQALQSVAQTCTDHQTPQTFFNKQFFDSQVAS